MEAKDTVIKVSSDDIRYLTSPQLAKLKRDRLTQAEKSFGVGYEEGKNQQLSNAFGAGRQAGIREVVGWIKAHPGKDKHTWDEWFEWQAKLKEWGIDNA